jgi:3-isopropylmalate dehydrogenase
MLGSATDMTETSSSTSTRKRVAIIPCDGIGQEVIPEAIKALRAAVEAHGHQVELTEFDWGADRYLRDGTTLPADAPDMFRNCFDGILLGAMGDPRVPSNKHANDIVLGLRQKLDLYVNIRPCVLLDEQLTPLKNRLKQDINFIILRENTEGLYAGVGGFFKKGTADEIATQEDVNTRKGVERLIRYAFELARQRGFERVCMSDKSNALTYGHDLWQRVFAEVRCEYGEIRASHLYIDNLVLQMVRDPSQFQVIVTCNLFGDIASDLGSQLIGGLGLAPSGNVRPSHVSLFEPVHGSAPSIAGRNIANPIGAILSAAMMLDHFGWTSDARAIENAVSAAVSEQKMTVDLNGSLGTREVGDWIAQAIADSNRT